MSIEVDAVYENGSLKLDHSIPLEEHQRVRVIVQPETRVSRRSYGIIGWTGDPDVIRKIALEPEHGIVKS